MPTDVPGAKVAAGPLQACLLLVLHSDQFPKAGRGHGMAEGERDTSCSWYLVHGKRLLCVLLSSFPIGPTESRTWC